MMRTLLSLVVVFGFMEASVADPVIVDGFQFEIPDGYEPMQADGAAFYVRRGNGAALLEEHRLETKLSQSFLEDWFFEDVVGYLIIRTQAMEDSGESLTSIVDQLKARWGPHSVSCPSASQGVTHFVNTVGAFVSVVLVERDGHLLLVESMDLVHVLVAENTPNPTTPEGICEHYALAANLDDALSTLDSAILQNVD
ncbi:MAG: hypothetical protein AAGL69_06035 [Pseudomonadota bacterium]